ncbi:type VII secretion protein EccE [Streptomyces harbinensis]|uniref:type VII secretion protein EccE n=1 Tax=Streptomyces harbinensis TaxID=1176198 RepID=UPI003397C7DF
MSRGFGRARWVALEAGLGAAAAGVAVGGAAGGALIGGGAVTLAGALLRRRGRWADQLVTARLRQDTRQPAPAGDPDPAHPGGTPYGGGPPDLARTLLPALDITAVTDRNGPPVGVLADGRGHAAVLAFPGGTVPSLPVDLIAHALTEDPARPAAAQVLVEQFGVPPWDFHYRYQPTVAYRQLPSEGRPVAVRAHLVLRYEPLDAPEAAARRGGGAVGGRAAVVAALARLRARLAAQGMPSKPLGPEETAALLRQTGDATGEGRALPGSWAGKAATHCTMTVPVAAAADWARLITALGGCTADRVVTAATLTHDDGIRVRTAVRLVSTVAQHAAAERDRLIRTGIVGPPAADQRAGLLATLPLAHPARSVWEAAGLVPSGAAR